ncbi:hypothetical protein S7335_2895 [Synechococcus sp. PCC 7335]|uniref:hypothetical protein n=1 Tax=Synechococcus sp. (strain ATCC 29403 / PCC 7335) TaxID=91464 RepID=UPI00017EE7F5|nr:hypothetical protein [Synechococcus sp. PCC 7335]EDX85196.1 hypothetical protein S7335_2895 [Synechococcus sp. PCC 7335]
MSKSAISFGKTLKEIFETYQLTLSTHGSERLILTQRLRLWAYSFLAVWSALFFGIPVIAFGMFALDCYESNRCQRVQFLGFLLIVSIFVLVSLLVAYFSLRKREVVLDKENNLYSRKEHTLIGVREKTYALDEIESINIKKSRHRRKGHIYYAYHLVIFLCDGKTHRLPGMKTRQAVVRVLLQMRSFLETQRSLGVD